MAEPRAICFGCGGQFDRGGLKDVGDALFCPSCFARLRAPIREADGDQQDAAIERVLSRGRREPATPTPGPVEPVGLCFLCGRPAGADAFVRLREFVICRACSEELTEDMTTPGPSPIAATPPVPPADIEIAPGAARPAHTPGTGTEVCAGCGRWMPGPGSYRLVDGRPFCPACAPLAAPGPAAPGGRPRRPTPTPAPTPEVVPVDTPLCDCCVRPLVASQFRATGGFWLCLACLDSDERLALAIARARYRRRLARMQQDLG
jgi:hypothetical protein